MLKKLSLIFPILSKLGYRNVAYMAWYRLSMKLGWRKRKFPFGASITGAFFKATAPIENYPESWRSKTLEKANNILEGKLTWFHYHNFQVGNPPNWFLNPFVGSVLNNPKKHWTDLSDFDLNTGDIKIIWEPSRFDWLTDLARAYRVSGEEKYQETMNQWLQDWSQHNPKNQGPNWKCGQETAIRVMKLITTTQLLDQDTTATKALQQLVFEHLERIAGNINYAIAQDNNHGTSEAAGLYIGATWLRNQENKEFTSSVLHQWKNRGRKLLEKRILKLIAPQGTFAQRSVTYHRVVVDTMSWVLYAMEQYNEPAFSTTTIQRLEKLGEWQFKMIASPTGDAPNIGSNDGAMFETLHNYVYRDFRPSTQLFFGVLKKQRVFDKGDYDEALYWRYPERYLSFDTLKITQPKAEILDDQFLIMQSEEAKLFVKIPSSQFRPSASDAFHLDVWHKGKNLLGDSGSYSYNAGQETAWYKSVQAHNTVQFGEAQQMPKVSRFLFGKWLDVNHPMTLEVNGNKLLWSGSYSDYQNNTHNRTVEWHQDKKQIVVTDALINNKKQLIKLYWHSNTDTFNHANIQVKTEGGHIIAPEIETTENSLYYLHKSKRTTFVYKTSNTKVTTKINY